MFQSCCGVWLAGLGDGFPQELTVRGVKREPCLVKVIESEAGRASALDVASPVTFAVVAGVAFAPGLHPFGDFEFVAELEHRSSSF